MKRRQQLTQRGQKKTPSASEHPRGERPGTRANIDKDGSTISPDDADTKHTIVTKEDITGLIMLEPASAANTETQRQDRNVGALRQGVSSVFVSDTATHFQEAPATSQGYNSSGCGSPLCCGKFTLDQRHCRKCYKISSASREGLLIETLQRRHRLGALCTHGAMSAELLVPRTFRMLAA